MEPGDFRHLARRYLAAADGDAVMGRVYRILTPETTELIQPRYVELVEAVGVIWYGQFRFLSKPSVRIEVVRGEDGLADWSHRITQQGGAWQTTPSQANLLLLIPTLLDQHAEESASVETRLESTAGLFSSLIGYETTYEFVAQQLVDLRSNEVSSTGAWSRSIRGMHTPGLGSSALSEVRDGMANLARKPERDRYRLSLRWFEQSLVGQSSDRYLKLWLALETLAMPETSNIRPVKDKLARIHGIDKIRSEDLLHVGWLHAVRARIVHDGEMREALIDPYVPHLMAIYTDLLREALHLPPNRSREEVLEFHSTMRPVGRT